jgi:hypothetical protein
VTGRNAANERLRRFLCLREVPGSNLCPEKGYPDWESSCFSSVFPANSGTVSEITSYSGHWCSCWWGRPCRTGFKGVAAQRGKPWPTMLEFGRGADILLKPQLSKNSAVGRPWPENGPKRHRRRNSIRIRRPHITLRFATKSFPLHYSLEKCTRNFNGKNLTGLTSGRGFHRQPFQWPTRIRVSTKFLQCFKSTQLSAHILLWLLAKLSQFIHALTDDVSMHCCVVHLVVSKMATAQERARCVGCLFESKSVIQTQWNYSTHISINHFQSIRQPKTSKGDFWKLVASMIVQEVVGSCERLRCAATARSPIKSTRV